MTCQHWVKRCRSRCVVCLHIVRICKLPQILVLVRLVVGHLVLKSLQNILIEALDLTVCLRMVSGAEIVAEAKYSAY